MIKQFSIVMIFLFLTAPAMAAGGNVELQKRDWSFSGPFGTFDKACLLYTSPSPRDATLSRMPSSA